MRPHKIDILPVDKYVDKYVNNFFKNVDKCITFFKFQSYPQLTKVMHKLST